MLLVSILTDTHLFVTQWDHCSPRAGTIRVTDCPSPERRDSDNDSESDSHSDGESDSDSENDSENDSERDNHSDRD